MTAPRHLWSGDWRRESAAAADELAARRWPTEEPSVALPPSPSKPSMPSAAARALARVRSVRVRSAAAGALARMRGVRARGPILVALAMLLSAGVGYAAVSSLVDGGSSLAGQAPAASSPASAIAPAWLGVETMNFAPASGVTVVNVVPGSPADLAGLQPGDVITQIGNRPVQAPTDLESALAGMHAGQRVEIRYERGPIPYTTQATLRGRPAGGP